MLPSAPEPVSACPLLPLHRFHSGCASALLVFFTPVPVAYLLIITGRLELVWLAFPIAELMSLTLSTIFLGHIVLLLLPKRSFMCVLGVRVLCISLLIKCYVFSFAPVLFASTSHDTIENLWIRLRQTRQLLNP